MEKTKSFVLTTEVHLRYDEESVEFKQALSTFNNVCAPDKGIDQMLEHVAKSVCKDKHKIVPGIGYVRLNGIKPEDPDTGIYADVEFQEVDII